VLYWFVFEKGLKAGGINTRAGITVPFVLWLIAGLVPWFFFQDSINGGTNVLVEYNYLVKKVVFKISILPIIKIISALFVHVFFIAFMLIMYVAMGFSIHLSYIQIIYYSLCVFALSLGLSYLTCSITVFFRDLTQVVNIVLQVGTWLTPIMWNFDGIGLPSFLRVIFKLNPMFYVVEGYRSALIEQDWFWQSPVMSCYFWGVVVVCFVVGTVVFRRLQVHFADVL
ncbi:MAG: ABC transporter permease, partial [Lachnospiraceae bacterium]|nr:ABC transporter permease [Lachnospiraceae bacterium]